MSNNPLLEHHTLPPFEAIRPEHVVPAIEKIIADNRQATEALAQQQDVSWQTLAAPLEALEDRLSQAWSPVSHLNSTMNNDALRDAYQQCLAMLSEYSTWVGQNTALFKAFERLRESDEYATLDTAQRKAIDNTLRNFRLAGVDLPAEKKKRYGEIQARLSELGNTFSNQLLDATQSWQLDLGDAERLSGLPESALETLKANAEAKGKTGYRITLDVPSFLPVMTFAEDRELRREVYTAYVTRASDQGPKAGENDNAPVIEETLALRQELAKLLGFDTYADYSLATKMAETPEQVLGFLDDLAERAHPQAQREFNELEAFAKETLGLDSLNPWDTGFASEKLRQSRYDISQEQLRPYFPAPRAVEGLFRVTGKLYDIRMAENPEAPRYHPDVKYFDVLDGDRPIAGFYLDLYAREGKRGGAWMDVCRTRLQRENGELQLPVAYLTCNFTPPVAGKPALLTHDEVLTLFHEFGHGLHHMLTQQSVADVSGISGVAWDAVELPSQFMENWAWDSEGIALISSHVETGETLPQDKLDALLAAKNFQSGMQTLRQVEFSLFDLLIHAQTPAPDYEGILATLNAVRADIAIIDTPDYNRFANGFSHIFAGGYAAGYYSYKWAELLSADAFSKFEEEGIFNPSTGKAFRDTILSVGGSLPAKTNFENFRGRSASIDALLRHSGFDMADSKAANTQISNEAG